ncbi:mandelate racemase/muconate lactonizing enzyme family protein [Pseudactinotalea sp. Z1732]|uniref:mandelate racemase/muconate lactonizing enzyme family protein n=1 Tax=Micrococcales TaxID=85006 RepID=UPI003C7D6141
MSRITDVSVRMLDIPVEVPRSDAIQAFTSQETPFVEIRTDDGLTGRGYTYTIGTGGSAVMALLRDVFVPQLPGQDARRIEAIWSALHGSTRATTTGALTSLALAAVDTALWDLKAQRQNEPLWIAAGGYRRQVPMYDTESGWLHLDADDLIAGAQAMRDKGWKALKVKVGKPTMAEDLERLRAVREVVGDDVDIMIDANQAFTGAEALRRITAFDDAVGIAWFEEPLPADDVLGHVELARRTSVPIAVGETLYSPAQFRTYLNSNAAAIVQVDVARVGGITPWLKVAHLAEVSNVDVCPHFLMELHVSLVAAIPNGRYVEHIPQLTTLTRTPVEIEGDRASAPRTPGLGIDWDLDRVEELTIA